jgi:hypothetical protein
MACSNVPSLTSTPEASCGGDPSTAKVDCSEVLVKFAEVETTMTIELGYFAEYLGAKPKLKPRIAQGTTPTHDIQWPDEAYLAGSLFQIHDYFVTPTNKRIIGNPEVTTKKCRINGGAIEDIKFFKKTPWEFFGSTTSQNFYVTDSRFDDLFEGIDDEGFLRKEYVREAGVVIERLKEQEANFKKYLNNRALKSIDYTGTMGMLYALASSGKLGLEQFTHKFKIGNNASNPGTTRKVKVVHNLFFKVLKGELASNGPTTLTELELEGKDFTTAGVGHDKKNCLKCVIVLNKQDGSTNDKGVYFANIAWGKGDGDHTFMKSVEDSDSCVRSATNGGTSGKAGFTTTSDCLALSNRGGPQNPLTKSSSNFVKIYDENNNLLKVITRAQQIRIIRQERDWALAASAAGSTPLAPFTVLYPKIWSNQNDVPAVRLAKPDVKSKGGGGYEVWPGMWLYLTPGPNATMGMIQGSAAQIQFLWPLETLALIGDDNLTLETLPGALWNMFGSGIAVVQVNYVQGAKDVYASVQWYDKMQQAMARMRELKLKVEGLQAQFIGHQQALISAFTKQDLAAYDKALNSMKQLANEFYNLTKVQIDFTSANTGRNNLEAFINAQSKLQIPPGGDMSANWLLPSPPDPTPPERNDPVPETPAPNIIATPEANVTLPEPAKNLVIPGDTVIAVTQLPFNPEALTPSYDLPEVGSGHLLDVVPGSGNFDEVGGTVEVPPSWDGVF